MAENDDEGRVRPRSLGRRRAARFGAVQALYQLELTGMPAEQVIAEFEAHRLRDLFAGLDLGDPPPEVDRSWFRLLVRGAWERAPELDPRIAACLGASWTFKRLGYLLRACLRAGAFELAQRQDVPVAAVIDEYVEIGHAFLDGKEHAFVHAVLDRLGRELRQDPET